MKTHAEKIREALTDLTEANPREIMEWISRHYPEESVKENSYRSDLIALASNHSATHHYPDVKNKFLLFDQKTKKYRLAPNTSNINLESLENSESSARIDAFLQNLDSQPKANCQVRVDDDSSMIDGIPVAKLSITGQIVLPSVIREKLCLNAGDTVAFITNEKGNLEVKKARLKLELE